MELQPTFVKDGVSFSAEQPYSTDCQAAELAEMARLPLSLVAHSVSFGLTIPDH